VIQAAGILLQAASEFTTACWAGDTALLHAHLVCAVESLMSVWV
jgi:hypothetical protein